MKHSTGHHPGIGHAKQRSTLELYSLVAAGALTLLLNSSEASGQTGVAIGAGSPTAHASAALDVQSTTQGMLVPRMTTAQRTTIASPAAGLLVFDTTLNQFWFHNGSSWQPLLFGVSGPGWSTTGNAGTDPAVNFIGTTDAQPVVFKRGGVKSGVLAFSFTAFGSNALGANTGAGNTAVGVNAAGNNISGTGNTAMGYNAMNAAPTNGSDNTVMGNTAGTQLIGSQNTAVGAYALTDAGDRNTAVGNYAGNSFFHYDCVFVGDHAVGTTGVTNSIAIGYNRTVTANNQVRIGNTSMTSIGGQVGWSTLSDARTKRNVSENVHGLDFILKLRPVTYNYDAHKTAAFLKEDMRDARDGKGQRVMEAEATTLKSREEQGRIKYTGFIAQEVEQAAKEVGYDFSGVDAPKNAEDLYGLRYAEFTVPLVKAVQEQQALIEAQQRTIMEMQRRLNELEAR